ncbi:TPA: hypothetical protein SL386_001676 [Pseudomonas aeruginosa]|uniref:hypothetical protein n=1 Tax=Pseudomonas aeruginosa TaxID=287 RepID=UPI000F84246D|nr:hypothetical protein [Pseudomonas aeruginosa]RTW54567.1 hypothetical protein DZA06_10705 [Pseudomonas aeruginosa]HEJ3436121.1 hypothetical protein [Pseudomonas aeruginosa]HEJ6312645.1 hypothetical protein [Pseudomonas aeruginosa]
MKITNVEWNEGAPKELKAGMLLEYADGLVSLIGTNFEQSPDRSVFAVAKRWAWLIQPHELAWLEDMANKHKARARG